MEGLKSASLEEQSYDSTHDGNHGRMVKSTPKGGDRENGGTKSAHARLSCYSRAIKARREFAFGGRDKRRNYFSRAFRLVKRLTRRPVGL